MVTGLHIISKIYSLSSAGFLLFSSVPGFSFDRDAQLYFDDTCVVPERLEGKEKNKSSIIRP